MPLTRVFLQFTPHVPRWVASDDVLIPLEAFAALSNDSETCRVDDVRARLAQHTNAYLAEDVPVVLREISQALGIERAELVGYEAAVLATVLEYWRRIFEGIAHDYPAAEFFTDLSADAAHDSGLIAVCNLLRVRIMHETLAVLFVPGADLVPQVRPGKVPARQLVAIVLDSFVGLARRATESARYRGQGLRRHAGLRTHSREALIIAHSKKKGRLLTQLRGVVTFTECTTSQVVHDSRRSPDTAEAGLVDPFPETSFDVLELFLRKRLASVDGAGPALSSLATAPWRYLLTDQEYDPLIRALFALVREDESKRIVATPEGAQSLVGAEMFSNAKPFFYDQAPIVRCATSVGEATRMAAVLPTESVIVSGYLAPKPFTCSIGSTITQLILRQMLRPNHDLVLVNLDNEPDIGAFRVGVPSMHDKLLSYRRLLEALQHSDFRILVTCKSTTGIDAVRAASVGRVSAILAQVPWTDLLPMAEVVIQRDSSLGPEAMEAGFPTIVWDDLGFPLASREWLAGNHPWVQYCTDESSLLDALGTVRKGITPKEHPHLWDLVIPERQVADWIVKDRAQGREVHTD